ncbi:hypothetical protein B0J11DRAFT_267154 [Dendryphion nanum]|uniref:Uncharacterized protein n=1 Tax=Dendryphion nanum TaxID=256645 RepID=A0A9P9IPZ2_9PLEO|nr:hypothetical protein B0J11DRAFT_267154 [Dendryphion nanum]
MNSPHEPVSHEQRLISSPQHEPQDTQCGEFVMKSWLAWTSAILATTFLVLTSVLASNGSATSHVRFLYTSSSNSIFVLSVLSSFTGIFLSATIAATFEKVQWSLISQQRGLRVSKFLSLQPGTGIPGLLTLLVGRGLSMRSSIRVWVAVRLSAILLVPILSILIMSKVNTCVVFDVIESSSEHLGWGMTPFNASLARNVSSIADQVSQADLANFLLQPYRTVDVTPTSERSIPCSHMPGKQSHQNCRRVYYLPGGLDLAATQDAKSMATSQVILAQDQQGYILDFIEGPELGKVWSFTAQECELFGFPFGAIHLCLRNAANNTLQARIVHCPISISSNLQCMENTTWPSADGWTTSLSTFFQKGTVAYSTTNGTILSHIMTNNPVPAPVSASEMLLGYRYAYSTFDNISAVLAAFSDPVTADMFPLYIYPAMVWANLKSISSLSPQNPAIATRAQDTFQCLLAIMLYYCQSSLFASTLSMYLDPSIGSFESPAGRRNTDKLRLFAQELHNEAPPDTKVRYAIQRYRLVVGKDSLIAYIVLCGTALLVCISTLSWVQWWTRKQKISIPDIGSFPAWDEWSLCEIRGASWPGTDTNNAKVGVVKAAEKLRICLLRTEQVETC